MTNLPANNLLDTKDKWPSIARDILISRLPSLTETAVTVQDIASYYGMTVSNLKLLLDVPAFQEILKTTKEQIDSLGPDAALILRKQEIAASVMEKLYSKFIHDDLHDKDSLRFLEILQKDYGKKEEAVAAANATTQVVITLPQLDNPKLNHLRQAQVIDVGTDYE